MRLKKTYSSREVASLTGLSARQLQIWDAGGLLSPTIPSHKTDAGGYTERRYTPIDLFERYAKGGENPKLKDWAGKTLPALQHHLKMAQALDKNRK